MNGIPHALDGQGFLDQLYEILDQHRTGIGEYQLIQELKRREVVPFVGSDLRDELILFRIHFLLFHLLYRLQDHLREGEKEDLEIHCLSIRLQPHRRGPQGSFLPQPHDPLRAYYRELDRLETTQRQDIQQMLADFWRHFQQREGRGEALAQLGLEEPASRDAIKRAFRDQAKRHHPDRGGDPVHFRRIAAAAKTLLG